MTLIAIMGIDDPEIEEAKTTIENLQAGNIRCHLISKDSVIATKKFAMKVSIIQDKANPYRWANMVQNNF